MAGAVTTKQGLRPVRILLDEMDIDRLIRIDHLKEDERQDPKALQKRSYASSTGEEDHP
jgi:hypothetical protein